MAQKYANIRKISEITNGPGQTAPARTDRKSEYSGSLRLALTVKKIIDGPGDTPNQATEKPYESAYFLRTSPGDNTCLFPADNIKIFHNAYSLSPDHPSLIPSTKSCLYSKSTWIISRTIFQNFPPAPALI